MIRWYGTRTFGDASTFHVHSFDVVVGFSKHCGLLVQADTVPRGCELAGWHISRKLGEGSIR